MTGRPDELRGEVIAAFVVLRVDHAPSEDLRRELLATVRDELGPVAVIGQVTFVDMLPKTRSGKIMRRVLKAVVAGLDPGDISTIEDEGSVEEARQAVADLRAGVGSWGRGLGLTEFGQPLRVDVVCFDLYGTLVDLAPLDVACEVLAAGRGGPLAARWRARQLEASWLRTAMDRWADFDLVTREALDVSCAEFGVDPDPDAREAVRRAFLKLPPSPERWLASPICSGLEMPLPCCRMGRRR